MRLTGHTDHDARHIVKADAPRHATLRRDARHRVEEFLSQTPRRSPVLCVRIAGEVLTAPVDLLEVPATLRLVSDKLNRRAVGRTDPRPHIGRKRRARWTNRWT